MNTTREDVLEAIRDFVEERGWRIREGDQYVIVVMAPLAEPDTRRNRWPHEPEEGPEEHDDGA